jgi:two-component sensor histidine kinase
LGIAVSAVFTALYPHPLLRLALGNSAFALLQFRVAALFLSRQNSSFRQSIRYVALILILLGTAELLQVAIVLVNRSQELYLLLKPIFSVVYQFGYIGLMMTAMHLAYARFQLRLSRQVEERNTLLKEMHHRTKNNLALVASLVSIESSQFQDPETTNAFNRLRTRIHTIASLHEQLQHSETSRRVFIDEYLSYVLEQTRAQYAGSIQNVEIVTEISNFATDSKAAITLGLITNELVANAMKHAFPAQKGGRINVRFSSKDGNCELVVDDDGIGIPVPVREGAMGMQLVNALVNQLAGRLMYSSESGTRYCITFPQPVSAKA